MVARNIDIIGCRIIFNYFDITDKTNARITAFKKIMAQDAVFPYLIGKCYFECVNVIKAFAGIGAFTQKILIGIGNGKNIRVYATIDGKDTLQE